MKQLLIVAHAPSPNTQALCEQIRLGAEQADTDAVEVLTLSAFNTSHTDVLNADAVILFTPENLGYMSGALKDFISLYTFNIGIMLSSNT